MWCVTLAWSFAWEPEARSSNYLKQQATTHCGSFNYSSTYVMLTDLAACSSMLSTTGGNKPSILHNEVIDAEITFL